MLVRLERSDGEEPVVVPGNPVKLSAVPEVPQSAPPGLGEHTDEVLSGVLGLSAGELDALRADGVIR